MIRFAAVEKLLPHEIRVRIGPTSELLRLSFQSRHLTKKADCISAAELKGPAGRGFHRACPAIGTHIRSGFS